MVTLELVASLPVLLLLLGVALSAISVAAAQVRAQDLAREVARAAVRDDTARAISLGRRVPPGAAVEISTVGTEILVRASMRVHLLTSWLPTVQVSARAVSEHEP